MNLLTNPLTFLLLLLINVQVSWASETNKLVFGFDHSPPYSYLDEDKAARGTMVDLVKKLAIESQLSFEFVFCPWARCISLIESGHIDLLAGLSKSEERQAHLLYIEPPIFSQNASLGFYIQDPRIKIDSYGDLENLVIGKLRGSQHFAQFDTDKQLNTVSAKDVETLFSLLKNGRIDTFIHMNETIAPYLVQYDPQNTVKRAAYSQEVSQKGYLVLSKHSGKTELFDTLSKALSELKAKGAFESLQY